MTEMISEKWVLPLVKQFAKYVLSFGVAFAAGLAPFLGKAGVPGFSALISIYPVDVQDWLIPLSGFLMGMIAVVVHYHYSKERKPSKKKLDRWFIRIVVLFGASFLVLLPLYILLVVRVEVTVNRSDGTADRTSLAVVTGSLTVPRQPPGSPCTCVERQSAGQCVQQISVNPMNVRACFGDQRVALATLALAFVYLLLTGSFVGAVGVFLLSRRR